MVKNEDGNAAIHIYSRHLNAKDLQMLRTIKWYNENGVKAYLDA